MKNVLIWKAAGVRTKEETWKHLVKVYGDTKLNILTGKQKLEGFNVDM